jgi:hypothetical protein
VSSSEPHLLYVLGTILLMLGLTERPVIAPYAITPRMSRAGTQPRETPKDKRAGSMRL